MGKVRFIIYDDRENSSSQNNFMDVSLSINNYYRLTIPPNVWLAFQGIGSELNLVLNIADMEHDPDEIVRTDLSNISYHW